MRLTGRAFAPSGITEDDLIHIVITGDTSQSPLGSSYKASLGEVKDLFGDIYVTGLTFNVSNYDLSVGRNDGISFTQSLSILSSDVTITGGTYNPTTGDATFTNNTGGTFTVTGFLTGMTQYWEVDGDNNNSLKDVFGGHNINGVSDYSIIGGGYNNIITGSTYSGIIAGSGNTISSASKLSVIAGGNLNTISGHTNAFIGGGSNNLIDFDCPTASSGNTNESIIGGDNNKIYSSYNSSIVGGSGNTVTNVTYGGGFNNLFGGEGNTLTNGVTSSIIGGKLNSIGVLNCTSVGSTIIGGSGNTLNLSSQSYSTIIGGVGNKTFSNNVSIIGGVKSTILTNSEYASLIGGSGNTIANAEYSIIDGGKGNNTTSSDYAGIFAGLNNYISSSSYSGIFAGGNNSITGYSSNSVIIGGEVNEINGHTNSAILGGSFNTIHFDLEDFPTYDQNQNEVIVGGQNNIISGASNSVISGGYINFINNFENSSIIGGIRNMMIDLLPENDEIYGFSERCNIIGGSSNIIYQKTTNSGIFNGSNNIISGTTGLTMSSTDNSGIVGGSINTINGNSQNSVIIGGSDNKITGLDRSVIVGGKNITATLNDYVYVPNMIVSTGGTGSRLGINTIPTTTLHAVKNSSYLQFDESSVGPYLYVIGTSTQKPEIATGDGTVSIGMGVRGLTNTTNSQYGNKGDSYIYSEVDSKGLNIIQALGTGPNYIRFYANQDANDPSHIHIQGTGSTKGYVGIGTESPTEKLDVNGRTKTTTIQITSGAANGYVLTSDASGVGAWSSRASMFYVNKTPESINNVAVATSVAIPDGQSITNFSTIYYNTTDISGTLTTPFGTYDNTTGVFTTTTSCILLVQGWLHLKSDLTDTTYWTTTGSTVQIGLGITPNNTTDVYVGNYQTIIPSLTTHIDISVSTTVIAPSGTTFKLKVLNTSGRNYTSTSGDVVRMVLTRID